MSSRPPLLLFSVTLLLQVDLGQQKLALSRVDDECFLLENVIQVGERRMVE